jgi:hypothetical protein
VSHDKKTDTRGKGEREREREKEKERDYKEFTSLHAMIAVKAVKGQLW